MKIWNDTALCWGQSDGGRITRRRSGRVGGGRVRGNFVGVFPPIVLGSAPTDGPIGGTLRCPQLQKSPPLPPEPRLPGTRSYRVLQSKSCPPSQCSLLSQSPQKRGVIPVGFSQGTNRLGFETRSVRPDPALLQDLNARFEILPSEHDKPVCHNAALDNISIMHPACNYHGIIASSTCK